MAGTAYAPASVRNSQPIMGVLEHEIRGCRRLLEIGSGTGFHAVTFGRAFRKVTWQASDLAENHAAIDAALRDAGLANVPAPVVLDVRDPRGIDDTSFDAVYTSNTAHIMCPDAARSMVEFASRVLRGGGRFLVYGPFRRSGRFSTPSNEAFDESLRAGDASMGIRDLEDLDEVARRRSMQRLRTYAMPASNLFVIWKKQGGGP